MSDQSASPWQPPRPPPLPQSEPPRKRRKKRPKKTFSQKLSEQYEFLKRFAKEYKKLQDDKRRQQQRHKAEKAKRQKVIDNAAAQQALRLADTYISEANNAARNMSSPHEVSGILNTLSLATKQIDKAEKLDPDVYIDVETDSGNTQRVDLHFAKFYCLYFQAVATSITEPEKSIPIFEKTIKLAPESVAAYEQLGRTYVELSMKRDAIRTFKKAVELDPHNIDLQIQLDRAQNMSAAAAFVTHSAKAARKTSLAVGSFFRAVVALFILFIIFGVLYSVFSNFTINEVGKGIFIIVGLGIAAKLAEWAGR